MRAKFINEAIADVLTGKSGEDIKGSMSGMRNVNRKFKDGETRLHQAAEAGQADVVKFLIEKGADVNIMDDYKKPPIIYSKTPEIIEILQKAGATTPLEKILESLIRFKDSRTEQDKVKLTKYILDHINGVSLNNVLSAAVEYQSAEMIKLLLDKGADVNFVDKYGKNLLMRVIAESRDEEERFKIIKLLIDYGINVNYIDKSPDLNNFGEDLKRHPTVLDFALRYMNNLSDKERVKVAKMLIDAGAKVKYVKNKYDQQQINAFLRKHKIISYNIEDKNKELVEAIETKSKDSINYAIKKGADVVWELKYGFNDRYSNVGKILARIESYDESKDTFKIRYLITNETANIKFGDFVDYNGFIVFEDKDNMEKDIKEAEKDVAEGIKNLNKVSDNIKKLKSLIKKL
jgi:ankyrin repeat protein